MWLTTRFKFFAVVLLTFNVVYAALQRSTVHYGNRTVNMNARNNGQMFFPKNTTKIDRGMYNNRLGGTQTRTSRSEKPSEDQIAFMDSLAAGVENPQLGPRCRLKLDSQRDGCHAKYGFLSRGRGYRCNLGTIYEIFFHQLKKDNAKTEYIHRGQFGRKLIDSTKFFGNVRSKFTLDNCNPQKKTFTMEYIYFMYDTVRPVPWLTLTQAFLDLEVTYSDLTKDVTDDWFNTRIKGTAKANINGESVEVIVNKGYNLEDHTIRVDFDDADVTLSIKQMDSMELPNFLSLFGASTTSLYPENDEFDHEALELGQITVAKRNSEDDLIRVVLSSDDVWSAQVQGVATGSSFFSTTRKFYVYCKIGEIESFRTVACGIMAKFAKDSFSWNSMTNILQNRDNLRLNGKGMLFELLHADELYFQTSRHGIEVPNSKDVIEEFISYSNVGKQTIDRQGGDRENNVFIQHFVTPATCVRVKVENVLTKYGENSEVSSSETILLHACPTQNKVRIQLPYRYPYGAFRYRALVTYSAGDVTSPSFGIPPDEIVRVRHFEARLKTSSEIEYCHKYYFANAYEMIPKKPGTVTLQNTTLEECNDGREWTLHGSGTETILKAPADITVANHGSRSGISGTLNIYNSKIIQDRADSSYLSGRYKRTFANLLRFPITDLRYEVYFQKKKKMFLKGKATMNGDNELRLESVYYVKRRSMHLALCLNMKNVHFGNLMGYLFDNPLMDQASWLKFSSLTIITRAARHDLGSKKDRTGDFDFGACKVEQQYDSWFPVSSAKEYRLGILLHFNSLDLSDCQVNSVEDHLCQFLQRILGVPFPMQYFGQLFPDGFAYLEGRVDRVLTLGPGILLGGITDDVEFPSRNGKLRHIVTLKLDVEEGSEEQVVTGKNQFIGTLTLEGATAHMKAKITFIGGSALLTIPLVDDSELNENLLGIDHVKAEGIKAEPYPLHLTSPLEKIEFHSRLRIGSSARTLVLRGGSDKTTQYVYGIDSDRNRFYACQADNQKFTVERVFEAFGAEMTQKLYRRAYIEEGCFTYHSGVDGDVWEISTRGIKAGKGLRLYGVILTDGKRLQMSMLFEDNAVKLYIQLPPLTWGVSSEEVSRNLPDGNIVTHHRRRVRLEASLSDSTTDPVGPTYYTAYRGETFLGGSITGFISTIGYAGEGEIVISSAAAEKQLYKFTYSGELFDSIDGTITLTSEYGETTLAEMEFTISVDIFQSVFHEISSVTEEIVTDYTSSYEEGVEGLRNVITEFEAKETKYNVLLERARERVSTSRAAMQRSKIERSRASVASKKSCARECKAVEMPGLNWNRHCMRTSKGQEIGCMKFVKDKHVVSDVGCLAKCEAERVRSHVQAIHHDAEARSSTEIHVENVGCTQRAESLKNLLIASELRRLKELKTEIQTAGKFFTDIKAARIANNGFITLRTLTSSHNLMAVSEPSCLEFDIEVDITTADVETTKSGFALTNERLCFGKITDSLIRLVLRKGYHSEHDVLQVLLDEAETLETVLKDNYEKNMKDKEEEIERCVASTYPTGSPTEHKKTYVPNMSLSPLLSSRFHIHSDETSLLFHKYSPWAVLEKNDPFKEVTDVQPVLRSSVEGNSNDPCVASRNSVQEYQDIMNYVMKWAKSHKDGEALLSKVRNVIEKRLVDTKRHVEKYAKNGSLEKSDAANMKHWVKVSEQGMKRWLTETDTHLHHLNVNGVKIMKDQLSSMYSHTKHNSIEDYIEHIASIGDNAIKKTNIAREREEPFARLSQELLNFMKGNSSLESVYPLIERIQVKIETVEKRTISCLHK